MNITCEVLSWQNIGCDGLNYFGGIGVIILIIVSLIAGYLFRKYTAI